MASGRMMPASSDRLEQRRCCGQVEANRRRGWAAPTRGGRSQDLLGNADKQQSFCGKIQPNRRKRTDGQTILLVGPVRAGMVVLPPSYEQPLRDLNSPFPLQRKRAFLRLWLRADPDWNYLPSRKSVQWEQALRGPLSAGTLRSEHGPVLDVNADRYWMAAINVTGANGQTVKPSVPVCPVRAGMVVLPPSYEQPFRNLNSPLPFQRRRAKFDVVYLTCFHKSTRCHIGTISQRALSEDREIDLYLTADSLQANALAPFSG
jgi:hypothetical protein